MKLTFKMSIRFFEELSFFFLACLDTLEDAWCKFPLRIYKVELCLSATGK